MRTIYLLLAFITLGVVIALLRRYTLPRKGPGATAVTPSHAEEVADKPRPEGCCGEHEVCEKESLITTKADVVYFEDEELDAYKGHEGDYTPEQLAEFEEVLFTLKEDEIAAWLKSLQLRGVTPPDSVREQALMIVSERRQA